MAPLISKEQRQKIVHMRAQGYKVAEISRALGTSRKTVNLWLKRWTENGNVTAYHRQTYMRATTTLQDAELLAAHVADPSLTVEESSAMFNISVATVRRRLQEAIRKQRAQDKIQTRNRIKNDKAQAESGDEAVEKYAAAVEEPAASSPSTTNENEMAHPVSLIKVSTAVDEEMVYAPAVEEKKCGACGNLFSGRVYVCLQCEYQLCAECEASGHHGEHYVLRVPAHKPKVEQEDIVSKMRVLAAKTLRVAPRAKEKKGKSPAIDRNIELETSQQDPLATDSNVEIKFEEDEDLVIDEHFGIPEVSTKVTGRVRKTNNKKTSKTPARTKTTPAASNTGLGTTRLMEIEVGQGTSSDSEGVFIKQEPEEPPESDTEISTEVTGSVRDTYSKKTSKTPARTKTTPAASNTGLGTTRLMEIEVEQATVLDSEGEVFIKQEPEEPPETDPEFQIQIVKVEELDDAPDQPPAKKTRLPNQ